MKLQFDGSQDYQLAAVRAVIDVFEGQPLAAGNFQTALSADSPGVALNDTGIANRLSISDAQILENVRKIQIEFNRVNRRPDDANDSGEKYFSYIEPSDELKSVVTSDGKPLTPLNFTVEMETGTGKTYTYLRTIYELHKTFGFKKFVVVVPSVAIREGALKNLSVTREHFQALYGNPSVNWTVYDSAKLTELRSFARSNAVEILVINIDSFAKDTNVINTRRETGIKPIEYVQSTRPVVIVDEPQNMETDIRKIAVDNLNPLCTLRYSATHKNFYNLIYNLNPAQAYDLGLVKQIEVDGIVADADYNRAFIDFKKILPGKKNLGARLGLHAASESGVREKVFDVDAGADLYELSGGRGVYRSGFVLNNIDAAAGFIEFSGGLKLTLGAAHGTAANDIARFQIERTVKRHFEKLEKHQARGIKTLSLFFIDRVSNYRCYDEDGSVSKGKFAVWFEEIFNVYASNPLYKNLLPFAADAVHDGYFSRDKKGKIRDTRGTTEADRDTYSLIMKNKERLLDAGEPLQFIFSHSALREGWDNPNVFQICTLNETVSETKKRQEIGRGLRLPVDAGGKRVRDKNINVLTVVANETYEDFARALQSEIETETGVKFTGKIRNASERRQIKLLKELTPENQPLFFEIWNKINRRARYEVKFSTAELIAKAVENLNDMNRFPKARKPQIRANIAPLRFDSEGVAGTALDAERAAETADISYPIPDVFHYVQSRVDVSRPTIYEIVGRSGRAAELLVNPQMFLDALASAVKAALDELSVAGVRYEPAAGAAFDTQLFKSRAIEAGLADLFEVTRVDKTLYNYIEVEDAAERDFASDCQTDDAVKFFFKLPAGFDIPTPLGTYQPGWAIILENDEREIFIADTKSAFERQRLPRFERLGIECAAKYFAALGVKFLSGDASKER